MKTLIFGAGTIGSVYASLLHKAGKDVTILARNEQYDFIKENGLVLFNEFTGKKESVKIKVVDQLGENDRYDLVVVAIRKNKLQSVLPVLSGNHHIKNILFLGNNVSGFDTYLEFLPKEKVLFGFGMAGGGRKEHVIHYVDSEKPGGKRMPLVMGEMDGQMKERTAQIKAFFERAGIPVHVSKDIDGWLKYHAAMVFPICAAIIKNDGDNHKLANNKEDLRDCLHAAKEAGNVLKASGYTKRQPFKFNFFYWLPQWLLIKGIQKTFSTKFAEIAIAMHARAAADEFKELSDEFAALAQKTTVKAPNIYKIKDYFSQWSRRVSPA